MCVDTTILIEVALPARAASSSMANRSDSRRTIKQRHVVSMLKVSFLLTNTIWSFLKDNIGYCKRGDDCWLRHELEVEPVAKREDPMEDVCNICLDKPSTYGLLSMLFFIALAPHTDFPTRRLRPPILYFRKDS